MQQLIYVFVNFVNVLISALQIMMFLRAILSWLGPDSDGPVVRFLYTVTEPLIAPVRDLLDRIPGVSAMPFDISFTVAYLVLVIVQMMLPTVRF